MNTRRWVGSTSVRMATGLLAALCVGLVMLGGSGSALTIAAAVATGVLALLGFVHSSGAIFARWIRFAEALNTAIVTALFAVCYLLVVPFFTLLLGLLRLARLRRPRERETAWVVKPAQEDPLSLERMG